MRVNYELYNFCSRCYKRYPKNSQPRTGTTLHSEKCPMCHNALRWVGKYSVNKANQWRTYGDVKAEVTEVPTSVSVEVKVEAKRPL